MIIIRTIAPKNPNSKYRTIIAKEDKETYTLSGILPDNLPLGLIIDVEKELNTSKGKTKTYKIMSYKIPATERNIGILKKSGIEDTEEFFKSCEIQNRTKLKWDRCVSFSVATIYETMDFAEADKIHKEIINDAEDIARLKAINHQILKKTRDKRKTSMTFKEYLEYFRQVEELGCYTCLTCGKRIECLKDKRILLNGGILFDKEIKEAEEKVNAFLYRPIMPLMTKDEIDKCKEEFGEKLSDEQLNCLDLLSTNQVSVITGGAGTGKTTVIKAIMNSYGKYYGTDHICMLAPTGKASRRIKEQTGFSDCSTIHSKLRKADEYIYYNEMRKLPYNLIIVDESSMIDILLMRDLLDAVDVGTKVIFVGDHNQLPPVDIGEPFFDFIKDKGRVSLRRLTINFRQGENNGILLNADAVLNEKELMGYENFVIRHIKEEEIGDYVSENTVCITPYNELNNGINEGLKKGNLTFNMGDKVIFLRNTKEYCNGDTGVITGFVGASVIVKTDFGSVVEVTGSNIKDIALAYALTIHKTQGSEYDNVKIFIPENDNFVTQRMLYTAITRAKKKVGLYYYEKGENKDAV